MLGEDVLEAPMLGVVKWTFRTCASRPKEKEGSDQHANRQIPSVACPE